MQWPAGQGGSQQLPRDETAQTSSKLGANGSYAAKRSRKTGNGETVTEELTVEGFSPGNGGETIEG
jgi:hypothetical protein